jgi:hypothetical protein
MAIQSAEVWVVGQSDFHRKLDRKIGLWRTGFHRWRDAQRGMHAADIVVHGVDRNPLAMNPEAKR